MLHGAPAIQVALCPGIPVPSEIGVEHVHELLDRDPGPAAAVEELYLQSSEEAPAPRAAGAASLPRHRSGQAVLVACPHPSRPAIATAAVRVDLGVIALIGPPARAGQRRAGHPGVGRGRYRPAQRHAAEQSTMGVHAPAAAGSAAGPGRLDHGLAGVRVPLGPALGLGAPRVPVAALGHAHHGQDLAEPAFSPQRLRHRRVNGNLEATSRDCGGNPGPRKRLHGGPHVQHRAAQEDRFQRIHGASSGDHIPSRQRANVRRMVRNRAE